MAESGIYEIVNLVNGKRYVGSCLNFRARWAKHRCELSKGRHHSKHLQASWLKYGEAGFEFRVLESCARDVLLEREQYHIDCGCDYNKCLRAGSPLGVKHSAETCRRMSDARAGKPKSSSWRAAAAKGVARSWDDPDVRRRRCEAIKLNWAKRKAGGFKFKSRTDEQRARHSAATKASYTPELRQRRSDDNKARWAKWRAANS